MNVIWAQSTIRRRRKVIRRVISGLGMDRVYSTTWTGLRVRTETGGNWRWIFKCGFHDPSSNQMQRKFEGVRPWECSRNKDIAKLLLGTGHNRWEGSRVSWYIRPYRSISVDVRIISVTLAGKWQRLASDTSTFRALRTYQLTFRRP